MIYEIRTYQIAPGSLAEVEKRFGEAYEYRKKYSELTAFWHTEVGTLSEFIRKMRAEIVNAFDFVPQPTPGKMGPVFEIRYYTLKGGTLPATAEGWKAKLPDRIKLSPVVLAGGVEFGKANGFVHIWAYQSLDQRMQIREEARKKGVWPPPGGADRLITQETKICLPSSFSPLQ